MEELQHILPGVLHKMRGLQGSRVGGMRVAKHMRAQELLVLAKLRFGIQPAAGVIEIDLPGGVEARVFAPA